MKLSGDTKGVAGESKPDLFEQTVPVEPEKKATVGELIDWHLADYYRRKREAGEIADEPVVKVPEDFDIRAILP